MYSRLRSLRLSKEISQTEMGRILGMSQTGYSKYETGENDIPTTILIELAAYHNTSVDYLLNLTDVKRPYPKPRSKSDNPQQAAGASDLQHGKLRGI